MVAFPALILIDTRATADAMTLWISRTVGSTSWSTFIGVSVATNSCEYFTPDGIGILSYGRVVPAKNLFTISLRSTDALKPPSVTRASSIATDGT